MLEIYRLAFLCAVIYMNVNCVPSPEYIVYPKLLEARGINGTKLLHIKDGLTLTLEKHSVLADSFVFTESNDGVATETIVNGTELKETLYRDREKGAAVALEEKHGSIEVMGVLSDTLLIVPLPFTVRSKEGHIAHQIYELEPSRNWGRNDAVLADILPKEPTRTKRQGRATSTTIIPDVFFVEVHMMIDSHHYKKFHSKNHLIKYCALNMAMVNMRFEDTSDPNIQFLLTSIHKEPEFAVTFVAYDIDWPAENRTYAEAEYTFDKLLENYGKSPADVTVAVTGLILADYYESHNFVDPRVKGQARIGGVCNGSYSIVMVEDVPWTYGMLNSLPHELGHALGAPHDGSERVWTTSRLPKHKCSKNSHFIMSENEPGNGWFSECSKEHMAAFISTLSAECFNIRGYKNCTTDIKELPGQHVNLTAFCKRAHPNFKEWNVYRSASLNNRCRFDCCTPEPSVGVYCTREHLPEGADCGSGRTCIKGKCAIHNRTTTEKL